MSRLLTYGCALAVIFGIVFSLTFSWWPFAGALVLSVAGILGALRLPSGLLRRMLIVCYLGVLTGVSISCLLKGNF